MVLHPEGVVSAYGLFNPREPSTARRDVSEGSSLCLGAPRRGARSGL